MSFLQAFADTIDFQILLNEKELERAASLGDEKEMIGIIYMDS